MREFNKNRPKTMITKLSKILTNDFLKKEYIDNKKSLSFIAEIVGCSAMTIRYRLKKCNIVIRNHAEGIKYRLPMTELHKENIRKNHAHLFGKDNSNYGNHNFCKEKSWCWKNGEYYCSDGYYYIYAKDHPKVVARCYIKRATFVMEQHIGRYLKNNEVVHHINEITTDDRIENLQLLTKSEHSKLHYNNMRRNKKGQLVKKNG